MKFAIAIEEDVTFTFESKKLDLRVTLTQEEVDVLLNEVGNMVQEFVPAVMMMAMMSQMQYEAANDDTEPNDPNLVAHLAALMREVDAVSWPSNLIDYSCEEYAVTDEELSDWIHQLDDIRRAA